MTTELNNKKLYLKTNTHQVSIDDCIRNLNKEIELPFKPYEGRDKYVFISYAHANKKECYNIMKIMHKNNINQWYDEGIPIASDWRDNIAYHIVNSFIFLPFFSREYMKSINTKKEIKYAMSKDKTFFPIFLEEIDFSNYDGGQGIEMYITDKQALLKYKLNEKKFCEKLISGIMSIMN